MAGKYDLSNLGKRALKTIRKNGGDNFLDKVARHLGYADGKIGFDGKPLEIQHTTNLGYGNQRYVKYPCVGLCPDEDGKIRWIPNAQKPLDREDLFRIFGTNFDDVELDPLMYTDDEEKFVREYASGLVNGDYSIGDLEGLIRDNKWKKFQEVLPNGVIHRYAYTPEYYGESEGGAYVYDHEPSKYAPPIYMGWMTQQSNNIKPQKQRSNPYRYMNDTAYSFANKDQLNRTGHFVNPQNISGEELKRFKKNWGGFEDWNMRNVKKRDMYDVEKSVTPSMIRRSRTATGNTTTPDPYRTFDEGVSAFIWNYFLRKKSEIFDKYLELDDKAVSDLEKGLIDEATKRSIISQNVIGRNSEIQKLKDRLGIKK